MGVLLDFTLRVTKMGQRTDTWVYNTVPYNTYIYFLYDFIASRRPKRFALGTNTCAAWTLIPHDEVPDFSGWKPHNVNGSQMVSCEIPINDIPSGVVNRGAGRKIHYVQFNEKMPGINTDTISVTVQDFPHFSHVFPILFPISIMEFQLAPFIPWSPWIPISAHGAHGAHGAAPRRCSQGHGGRVPAAVGEIWSAGAEQHRDPQQWFGGSTSFIWVNYNDLTVLPHWKSWLVRGIIPKWPQDSI